MPGMTKEEFMALVDDQLPMAAEFDPIVDEMTPGRVVIRFPFNRRLVRPGATINGPTVMALADLAMYVAILAEDREAVSAVTASMTIHFLQAPEQKDLIAECVPLKMGKRLMTLEVLVYSEGVEPPVAHVTGSYMRRGPSK